MTRGRYNQIDGLNGILAIIIALRHYYSAFNVGGNIALKNILFPVYEYGYLGVELFFILSGFLIAFSYKGSIKSYSFSGFIGKRIKKIYPIYFLTLLFSLSNIIMDNLFTGKNVLNYDLNFYNIFINIFLLTSIENIACMNGVAWFLCVIIVCYILYFFLVKYSKNNSVYMGISAVIILIGYLLFRGNYQCPLLYDYCGRGYMCFFVGCLIYEFQNWASSKLKLHLSCVLIVITIITISLTCKYDVDIIIGKDVDYIFLSYGLVFAPGVLLSTLNIKPIAKIFSNKLFVALGKISMSIYLFHYPILKFIQVMYQKEILTLNHMSVAPIIVYLSITLVISTLSYILFEKRLIPKTLNQVYMYYK